MANEINFKDYGKHLAQYPPLTKQQTLALFETFHKGDESAKETLIVSNLRLVVSVCNKYSVDQPSFDDLIQEGNLGLMEAITHFNPAINDNFATYAIYWIQKYILEYFRKDKMIVVPQNIKEEIKRMNQLQDENPQISDETIAKTLGCDLKHVQMLKNVRFEFVQLEEYDVPKMDEESLIEGIIDDLLENIDDERDLLIVQMYIGLNGYESHTFEQIGQMLHISKVAVQKRYRKTVARLKEIYDRQED